MVKAVHAEQEERCTELYGTGKVYCPGARERQRAAGAMYGSRVGGAAGALLAAAVGLPGSAVIVPGLYV